MAYSKGEAMGWFTQSESSDIKVEVKSSDSKSTGTPQTEFLFVDRTSNTGQHSHIAINDSGDVVYNSDDSK